jgi:rhodanese-related sulfurtransferase
MAASCTTSCASSQPRLSGRTNRFGAGAILLGALALAACSGEKEKDESEKSGPAPSFLPRLAAMDMPERSIATMENAVVDATPEDVQAMIESGRARLIDIRTDDEVAAGMIPGAEHIAMDSLDPAALDDADGRTVVLYCRSGRRSRVTGEKIAAYTGQPAIHLAGGILAWQEAGNRVE